MIFGITSVNKYSLECNLVNGFAESNRSPLVVCEVVSLSWGCLLPVSVDLIPRYLNEYVLFIWGTISVSDVSEDTIFTGLVVGLSIRKGCCSGVKSHYKTFIAHLLISSLPPDI